eukprot:UN24971
MEIEQTNTQDIKQNKDQEAIIDDENIEPFIPLDTFFKPNKDTELNLRLANTNEIMDCMLLFFIDELLDIAPRIVPKTIIRLKDNEDIKGDNFKIPVEIAEKWPKGLEDLVTVGLTTEELGKIDINPNEQNMNIQFVKDVKCKKILSGLDSLCNVVEKSFLEESDGKFKVLFLDTDVNHMPGWLSDSMKKPERVPFMHYYIKPVEHNNENNDKWWFVVCSFALIKYGTFDDENYTLFEGAKYEYVDVVVNYRYYSKTCSPLLNLEYSGYPDLANIWVAELRGVGRVMEKAFKEERKRRKINMRLLYADDDDKERTPYWKKQDFQYLKLIFAEPDVVKMFKNLNFDSDAIDELYDELARLGEPGDDYSDDIMLTRTDVINWMKKQEPFEWSDASSDSEGDSEQEKEKVMIPNQILQNRLKTRMKPNKKKK